jgi:hypothetical protein
MWLADRMEIAQRWMKKIDPGDLWVMSCLTAS